MTLEAMGGESVAHQLSISLVCHVIPRFQKPRRALVALSLLALGKAIEIQVVNVSSLNIELQSDSSSLISHCLAGENENGERRAGQIIDISIRISFGFIWRLDAHTHTHTPYRGTHTHTYLHIYCSPKIDCNIFRQIGVIQLPVTQLAVLKFQSTGDFLAHFNVPLVGCHPHAQLK